MERNQLSVKASAALSVGVCILLTVVYGFISPDISLAAGENDTAALLSNDMVTVQFSEDVSEKINNPERGWYSEFTTDDVDGMDSLKAKGIDNVMLLADFGSFKSTAISENKLQDIRNAFTRARKFGLGVIFHAAYDFDGVSNPEPKDISIIKNHIAQLKPIFTENEDILFCVQAGFLGPWGEWHTSYYGDPPSLSARTAVLTALMNAVPKSRQIEVRRPMFIRDMYPKQMLSASTAFNQSNFARTGYHDDALLSTEDENGTYVDPSFSRKAELNWADNHDKYTPFVGESDELSSYSDPDNAVYELGKLHAQILNSEYLPEVLNKWKNTTYQGANTFDYISKHLGYRFVLSSASLNRSIEKGGALHLMLRFQNTGFANLINARDYQIVLSNGADSYIATVKDDARFWTKDRGTITQDLYFSIPSDIPTGAWKIYVNMPNMSKNPLYSIRFANKNTWVASKGYNLIGTVSVASSLPNSVTSFKQISKSNAEILYAIPPSINALPQSYNKIKISWGSVGGATSYMLYRATSKSGPYTKIATLSSTSYMNSVSTGTTYYYKVQAYLLSGSTYIYGQFSDIVSAKAVLGKPGSVKTSVQSYNKIKISWDSVGGATAYKLYRATSKAGPYKRIATLKSTFCTNTGVTTGTTYYYKVEAYRLSGSTYIYSPFSDIVSAKTVLGTPQSVKTSAQSYNKIKITWKAVAGRTKYELWRSTSKSGPFTRLKITSYTYYTNTSIKTGTTYYYRVRAYRLVSGKKVYGAYSKIASIHTTLGIPSSIKAVRYTSTSVKVSWGGVTGATKYEIWNADKDTLIASTGSRYYISKGLVAGNVYHYKVRAYRLAGTTKVYSGFTKIAEMKL
jgi:fibronectin type 3 domain-containing protein